jgi:polygalacturonase
MDPESCDGVEIIGCRFQVGDDCIAIKSGKIELGRSLNRPAVRHTIRNCLMGSGHGAVTLGSEIGAGVRELTVERCLFRGTDRGLRIKTRRGRGENCRVDAVCFENIRMEGVLTPIAMNMWYNCCDPDRESEYVWSREKLPVDERTPYLGRFCFRGLRCTGAHAAACYADGLPEAPIAEIRLEDMEVSFAPDARSAVPVMKNFAEPCCRLGLYFDNVGRVVLKNVRLQGTEGEPLQAHHCGEMLQEGFRAGEEA